MNEYDHAREAPTPEQRKCNLADLVVLNVATEPRLAGCTSAQLVHAVLDELERAFRCTTERETHSNGSVSCRVHRKDFAAVFREVVRCLTGEAGVAKMCREAGLYRMSCSLPDNVNEWGTDAASFPAPAPVAK